MAWPRRLVRMDAPRRGLALALIVSLLLHAVLLSIHFKFPTVIRPAAANTLEVVLVNAKSARRPADAQAKAQANLDGGGNTEEDRRAKTPLPASQRMRSGNALLEVQSRVQALETQQQQQQLLAKANSAKSVQAGERRAEPEPVQMSGLDVEIRSDGSVERVEVQRSSGHRILDEIAQRIVHLAAPYGSFPATLKRQTDIIAFARTWVFTKANQVRAE